MSLNKTSKIVVGCALMAVIGLALAISVFQTAHKATTQQPATTSTARSETEQTSKGRELEPLTLPQEDEDLDKKRFEEGRQKIARLFNYLLPVERAVLVHSETVAAGGQTGHDVAELDLPVSEKQILNILEEIDSQIAQGNASNEALSKLRLLGYGADGLSELKDWPSANL